MSKFENAEIRSAGRVVRADVDIDCFVPVTGSHGSQHEWGGILLPPNNTGLEPGERYKLILPGYPPVEILITEEANQSDGTVPFLGKGKMPLHEHSQHN